MTKGDLLKGRGSGIPFFLAWVLGAFVALGVDYTLQHLGFNRTYELYWNGLIASLSVLAFWQGILLFPTWGRRIGWALAYVLGSVRLGLIQNTFSIQPAYYHLLLSTLLQAFFLIGARQRAWTWLLAFVAVFVTIWKFDIPIFNVYWGFYKQLGRFVNKEYLLSYLHSYYLLHIIIFGAVVAFFMPPVTRAQTSGN